MLGIMPIQSVWADSIVQKMVLTAYKGLKPLVDICNQASCLNELFVVKNVFATALIVASLGGHLEIVKYLISKGVFIDITNEQGYTALMYATSGGDLEMVKYLRVRI